MYLEIIICATIIYFVLYSDDPANIYEIFPMTLRDFYSLLVHKEDLTTSCSQICALTYALYHRVIGWSSSKFDLNQIKF